MLLLSHGRVCMGLVALHEALAPLSRRRCCHVPIVLLQLQQQDTGLMINTLQQHLCSSITDYDL